MELLLRALKFKPAVLPGPVALASLLAASAALSACNSSKMLGDITPGETLTQG